jgi:glycosyltransferase involved in cell wall biosynthesis
MQNHDTTAVRAEHPYRILMIAPQPFFSPRGTPFSVLHRIKALTLLGHRVDLATYHLGQTVDMEGLTYYRARPVPGVRRVRIGPSKRKIALDLMLYGQSRALAARNEYDLIHTHEEASFWGAGLAKKYGLPHLYDMHSSLPQQLDNFKYTRSRLITSVFRGLESRTLNNADAVITICPELQKYVENHYPDKTSILIENVADNRLVFPPDSEQLKLLKAQYHLEGRRVVLYYGTFEAYQGIDLLIDSAEELVHQRHRKELQFLMVGGSEEQVRNYRNRVEQRRLTPHFQFTGFVQPQQIPGFVDLADVLVSPRKKGNNSPLKIYSYLRSGKPIVATDHITHTQILNPDVAELTGIDSRAFADGIAHVLDDTQRSRFLTENAAALAEKKYSYEAYLKKVRWIVDRAVTGFKQKHDRQAVAM